MKLGYCVPLLLLLVSCAQISGFDDLEFTDTDTGNPSSENRSCGFTDSYAPCQDCFNAYCCDEGVQCASNSECTDLLTCSASCAPSDSVCNGQCLDSYPNGFGDLMAMLDCRNQFCGSECSYQAQEDTAGVDTATIDTDPPAADTESTCGGISWNPPSCQTCYETECCTTGIVCAANASCTSLLECMLDCPTSDATCFTSCSETYPAGSSDLDAMFNCVELYCSNACS